MNIKGMDKDMKCRGFQFEIGQEYKINTDNPLQLCTDTVFHYCKNMKDVNDFYGCNIDNRFFEIEVLGEEIGDGKKYGSNHIKILREIKGDELDTLLNKKNGNAGIFNSGYKNSGYKNSGDWNSGNCNSGNWNSCNYSAGIFCSEADENIRIFNKPSGMSFEEFLSSEYRKALCSAEFNLTEWVEFTEEEMEEDERKAMIGGCLKTIPYKEACARWWSQMTEENKKIIQSMPNFDEKIFKDITGIDI